MNAIRQFIEGYVPITDNEWRTISPYFTKQPIEKDEILLKEGKICKHLYFLESGLLHFYINKEGKEITKFFTIAPYFFTSQASFNSQNPASENIQAIENSVIWKITYQQSIELLKLDT